MPGFWVLLWRALILRCPRCGRGKLFERWFTLYKECSVCHYVYERNEEGFFTGALAINLIFSEFLAAAIVIPISVWAGMNPNVPFVPILLATSPLPILFPFIFYRPSRGIWICMYYLFNTDDPRHEHP